MNARREAEQRLGGRYAARVLEPSPPAIDTAPWFADDPLAGGPDPSGRQVVSPLPNGDLTWAELAEADAALASWCADRWLAAYPRLQAAPAALVETRTALHRLASDVISPARQRVNGKIGLRYTHRGFGTPFFGADEQLRVEGAELIRQRGEDETREAIDVELDASLFLGEWYGFAASVLELLRFEAGERADPSRVQLWPEHFDLAVELGQDGARAAYGCSPGDEEHPEPYIYVAPWNEPQQSELWNAVGFTGAELAYSALVEAEDQRGTALDFLRARLAALLG
jgi:hypothetical protein